MQDQNRKRRRSTALAAGAGASLLLAVVANSAIAAPTPAPTKAANNAACPATPGVTPTTVTVGWIGPKTGPAAANYLFSAEAAQLRIDQQNAKGGVNGRKIIMKTYDDASNASSQISAVQKAIQSDNIFALNAQTNTTAMYATLKDNGIPVTGFSNPAFGTDRNAFGANGATVSSNPAIASTATLEKLKQMGVTKLANINHISTGASASGNATAGLIPLVGGLTQVLRIADEPQGTHDATSTALRIKNSGADGAVIVGFIDGGISIMQALKQQGVNLKGVSIVGLSDPASLKSANGALDGALGTNYGTVPVGVPNNAAVRTFANGMKAAGLNPYSSAAPMGFLGSDVLIKGLQLAGKCPTRESFITNLRNLTSYNGGGLLPEKISFKGPGIMPNGNPAVCTWYMIAKGTNLVPDAKATCGAKYIDTASGKVVLG
ncbi:MAG: ABC transporter substrate-binding protein [Candidatus Nanopelagicales bacterium]|nr:ABC transporter substrate-binding protein [Candidatus Nanopelagicales bacterium]